MGYSWLPSLAVPLLRPHITRITNTTQDVRGRSKTTSFSPAAAWKGLAFGSPCSPKANMGNQKKKKNRAAAGEIYGVMNDCVRPTTLLLRLKS